MRKTANGELVLSLADIEDLNALLYDYNALSDSYSDGMFEPDGAVRFKDNYEALRIKE